jgi:hypothetical protein
VRSAAERRSGAVLAWCQYLLRQAVGIDVGGVDEVDAGVEAHVDLAPRALDVRAPDVGELAAPAEGHRPQGERRDLESRTPELAVFHVDPLVAFRRSYPTGAPPCAPV